MMPEGNLKSLRATGGFMFDTKEKFDAGLGALLAVLNHRESPDVFDEPSEHEKELARQFDEWRARSKGAATGGRDA